MKPTDADRLAAAELVGLLRFNLEDGDRRMAIENCNALISLLETGDVPRDLSAARKLHAEIEARLVAPGVRGNSLVRRMGSPLISLGGIEEGKRLARAEGGNPCDGIFDHKWLSPSCVADGCRSLDTRRLLGEIEVMEHEFPEHTNSWLSGFARARKMAADLVRATLDPALSPEPPAAPESGEDDT